MLELLELWMGFRNFINNIVIFVDSSFYFELKLQKCFKK